MSTNALLAVFWTLLWPLAHGAGGGGGGGHETPEPGHAIDEIFGVPLHPILVNFTAALIPLSLLSDLLGRAFRRDSLHATAWWTLLYAAVLTPLTALAGWLWLGRMEMTHDEMAIHKWLGTGLAVLLFGLVAWRGRLFREGRAPGASYLGALSVVVLAVVVQGHLGGVMTFFGRGAAPGAPAHEHGKEGSSPAHEHGEEAPRETPGPALTLDETVEHYVAIQKGLSADRIGAVSEHAPMLARSDRPAIAKAADDLLKATGVTAARSAFADLSKALIAELEAEKAAGRPATPVYVFECPMAKPYGRWVQKDADLANPYYGAAMPKCGEKVGTIGEPPKEPGPAGEPAKEPDPGHDHDGGHHH